ncbi:MAG: ligase-associated DNA damage response endonuclease PdeM [Ferruginibacter sp.]
MTPHLSLSLLNQQLLFDKERAMLWENERTLIVSDVHLGKTGHFRKSGIAIPQTIYKEDLQRLVALLQFYKPEKLLVVGDMFHSAHNKELDLFLKWRNDFSTLTIQLIKGNHDILPVQWYATAAIDLIDMYYLQGPFCFVHDIADIEANGPTDIKEYYTFSGHVHPGITLKGISKQSLQFPCFHLGKSKGILPAFSRFTGMHPIKSKKTDTVIAIIPANNDLPGGVMKI